MPRRYSTLVGKVRLISFWQVYTPRRNATINYCSMGSSESVPIQECVWFPGSYGGGVYVPCREKDVLSRFSYHEYVMYMSGEVESRFFRLYFDGTGKCYDTNISLADYDVHVKHIIKTWSAERRKRHKKKCSWVLFMDKYICTEEDVEPVEHKTEHHV